jgi:8-oxo-dGTP pyrophosphatase MutT (NUDIX family)
MKPWQVLESTTLVERPWLKVEEQRVLLPNGGTINEFHLITGPDWVAVLALTEARRVVLVEQYRHGAARTSRELPAGVIDPGETPLVAAQRELLEETGHAADEWRPLLSVQTEPARHTTRAHFFFASGAKLVSEPRVEPCENIDVHLVTIDELMTSIDDGQLFHGVHIGAILTAERRGWLG